MSSTVVQGATTIGASTTQLTTSAVGGSVIVIALSGNSGTAYLGNSSVTSSDGFPLIAGATVQMDIIDASRLWVAGTQNDIVRYLVVGP